MRHLGFIIIFLLAANNLSGQVDSRSNPTQNSISRNLKIAQSYFDNNELDSALYYYNAILDKKPNHEEALFMRARVHFNQFEYEKALVDYNAIIAFDETNKEAFYARGTVRYQLEQYDLAIADFEQTLKLPNEPTQTAFFKMDANQGATGIFTMSSLNADLYNHLGLCYLKKDDLDAALQHFNEGLTIEKNNNDLLTNRARIYEKQGNQELAIKDLERVLQNAPQNTVASINLIRIKRELESGPDYLDQLNNFVLENPENAEGYSSRGIYFYENMLYESALLDFSEALTIEPQNIDNQFNMGLCHSKLNNIPEAEKCFSSVIDQAPNHSGAYFNMGNLMYKSENFEEAISYYSIALSKNPDNQLVRYNRALSFGRLKQYDQACEDIEKIRQAGSELGDQFFLRHCNQ